MNSLNKSKEPAMIYWEDVTFETAHLQLSFSMSLGIGSISRQTNREFGCGTYASRGSRYASRCRTCLGSSVCLMTLVNSGAARLRLLKGRSKATALLELQWTQTAGEMLETGYVADG